MELKLTQDWNRKPSYVNTAKSNIIDLYCTTRSLFSAAMCCFSSSRSASLSSLKNRNNSLIRDQKSNKHIADGYKKLFRAFKREVVQFLVAKNLAASYLPLKATPAVQT